MDRASGCVLRWKNGTEAALLTVHNPERAMTSIQLTHFEVVLLTWQQLPGELLNLSAHWIYVECRFYRIAQVDIAGDLNIELLGLFGQLKEENRITDFCGRVVPVKQRNTRILPDTADALKRELPDWVLP